MHELQELLKDIEKLRTNLHQLIEQKGIDLQDPEVISSSQALNTAITKYNEMIRRKI
ncbi:MAG: Spo0E like sporulation regulatory protein [Anaerosolibacter sp.]|jgi:hypothetical protein|uniref:aspartyl-phosphate phosphatase Spo0E family protein n=1 Tax=Anaerosolibacter sp. TaxID=1872527 RepID=UPI0026255F7A|nr:aspartyl-phosphate phosphatase Spo0E family protein [Anaerosolibacter sp.]MDF2546204.1 Spo0E like sporulation regulatory protein [Anaerosolibacter sp.]